MSKRNLSSIGIAVITLLAPLAASAHTVLINPKPLTNNDNLKTAPCGCVFDSGEANECPADFMVTQYDPGESITVTFNETINHNGDFRVSFVPKPPSEVVEADFTDATVQETIDDTTAAGELSDVELTLPNMPGVEGTIQVRQFMMGADAPYYYTCASVKIAGPTGEGGGSPSTGGASGEGGAASGGGGGASGSGGSTANNGSDGEGGEPVWVGPYKDDGCSVTGAGASGGGALTMLALGLLGLGHRRRSTTRRG